MLLAKRKKHSRKGRRFRNWTGLTGFRGFNPVHPVNSVLLDLSRRFGRLSFGAFPLAWHFISRGHLVFRFGRAEEPVVKPTNNILQTLDPMPRLTGARELVRLVREPHHHRRDFPELERAEHFLAARARRRSVIGLTQNKHHRRLHILDISDGRARFEILFLIERRPFEPGRLKQGEVRCVPPSAQLAMSRCATAAAKRVVCPTTQFVSNPPPLPPVTPSFLSSM